VTDSVQQRIIDDVESSLLALINGTGDYATDLAQVYVSDGSAISNAEIPAVFLFPGADRLTEQRIGLDARRLELTFSLVLHGGESDWERRLRAFVADVQRALVADHARGDLAIDTIPEEDTVFEGADECETVEAEVKAAVVYRTQYGDPTTPM